MAKVNLGDLVKDSVSGFKGIVVATHNYLNGCTRVSIQPPVDKDGKLPDALSFDEPQVEVIKPKKAKEDNHKTGGPAKFSDKRRY